MKFLFLSLLLATVVPAQAANTFDDLIRANGGEVPFPFEKFFDHMDSASVTLIPIGRSRQKQAASYINPRIVVAEGQPDFDDKGGLFIGYAPAAGQLEVIAWNQEQGRYDFLEVTYYREGGAKRVTLAEREVCTVCHQSEGPIFSRFPWAESIFNVQTLQKVIEARGEAPYHGIAFASGLDQKLGRAKVSFDPAKIDRLVRVGNRRLQIAQACRTICDEDLECRGRLLLAALIESKSKYSSDLLARDLRADLEREFEATLSQRIPDDSYAYHSSIVPDRDPTINEGTAALFEIADRSTLLPYAEPRLFPAELLLSVDLNYDDRLAEFLLMEARGFTRKRVATDFSSAGHPGFERPKIGAIARESSGGFWVAGAPVCLGLSPAEELELSFIETGRLREFADTAEAAQLIRHWPPKAADLMKNFR